MRPGCPEGRDPGATGRCSRSSLFAAVLERGAQRGGGVAAPPRRVRTLLGLPGPYVRQRRKQGNVEKLTNIDALGVGSAPDESGVEIPRVGVQHFAI